MADMSWRIPHGSYSGLTRHKGALSLADFACLMLQYLQGGGQGPGQDTGIPVSQELVRER
jgi:hypothetical protein